MQPKIETITEKKLVGNRLTMSLMNNRTSELWSNFISRRNEVQNSIGTMLYSLQVYEPGYFDAFDSNKEFEKWAAVEVLDFKVIPKEMEAFTLPKGLYAIFHYKGSSNDKSIFQYIFGEWLPNSNYRVDNRPHFEMLGEKYKNADPNSEEDVYIPIRR
jgi:AraC family transcriptional regulator